MPNQLEICNAALIRLGGEPISSINEESRAADLCKWKWDSCRRRLAAARPWNFEIKRVKLAQAAAMPEYGYAYAYDLPTDFVGIVSVHPKDAKYLLEGPQLLADEEEIYIRYKSDVSKAGLFSQEYAQVLDALIAFEISYALTGSKTMQQTMFELYKLELANASRINASAGSPDTIADDPWLQGRGGRRCRQLSRS